MGVFVGALLSLTVAWLMARRSERVQARGGARLLRADLHAVQAELRRIQAGGAGSTRAGAVLSDLRTLWRAHRQALAQGLKRPEWERVSVALQLARAPSERVDQTVLDTQRATVDAALEAVDGVVERLELGRRALLARRLGRSLRPAPARGAVSLADVVRARFLYERTVTSEPEAVEQAAFLHQLALSRFEAEHGPFTNAYWATTTASAVALTRKAASRWRRLFGGREEWRLHYHLTAATPEAASVAHEVRVLAVQISEVLTGAARDIGVEWLFAVSSQLIASEDEGKTTDLRSLREDVSAIRTYYERAAQRSARILYFGGMMLATLALAGLGALLAATLAALDSDVDVKIPTVAIAAGAIGAIVSALLRLSTRLVRYPMSRRTVRALGGLGVVVGAVFGAFTWLLLSSGVLGFQISDPLVVAAIAFVAGFGERLVQLTFTTDPGAQTTSSGA